MLHGSQGGEVIVPETSIQQATTVIAKYAATVSDPKATVNIIFEYAEGQVRPDFFC